MNKDVFKISSPLGSNTILVFPYQTLWQYSDMDPLTAAKSRFSTNIWLRHQSLLDCCLSSAFPQWSICVILATTMLDVPGTEHVTIGGRAFSSTAARQCSLESLDIFQRRLKTELFARSYN